MNPLHPFIAVCLDCPKRQRPCAGACACTLDGIDITEHAAKRECPERRYAHIGNAGDSSSKPQLVRIARADFPKWDDIHAWALTTDDLSERAVNAYLDEIGERLSRCDCRARWKAAREAVPVDRSSNLGLFNWTVDRHNDVNALPHVNRPQVSHSDAMRIHQAAAIAKKREGRSTAV